MKGDFSRDTFDPKNHFLKVLMQQGRVQLDADWNEQASILLHYIQTLAADLFGPYGYGGQQDFEVVAFDQSEVVKIMDKVYGIVEDEFEVDQSQIDDIEKKAKEKDNLDEKEEKIIAKIDRLTKTLNTRGNFLIGPGHFYVDGILCENEKYLGYQDQEGYPFPDSVDFSKIDQSSTNYVFVYIDVWERHFAWYEQPTSSIPRMREIALRGPDTATRSKLAWQVKVKEPSAGLPEGFCSDFHKNIKGMRKNRGLLRAMAKKANKDETNPCSIPPKARYRGTENQLYRVEIHTPGNAREIISDPLGATFKWSRDNGSVVFPLEKDIVELSDDKMIITLTNLGSDDRSGLNIGDWVEFVHDEYTLRNQADPLLKVDSIDQSSMEVILKWKTNKHQVAYSELKQPFIRRWDQTDNGGKYKILDSGDIPFIESNDDKNGWIELEDGVQIQFLPLIDNESKHNYQTGDYWLIPARTETGNVEWPYDEKGNIKGLQPHGIEHHYAPLAVLTLNTNNITVTPCGKSIGGD